MKWQWSLLPYILPTQSKHFCTLIINGGFACWAVDHLWFTCHKRVLATSAYRGTLCLVYQPSTDLMRDLYLHNAHRQWLGSLRRPQDSALVNRRRQEPPMLGMLRDPEPWLCHLASPICESITHTREIRSTVTLACVKIHLVTPGRRLDS